MSQRDQNHLPYYLRLDAISDKQTSGSGSTFHSDKQRTDGEYLIKLSPLFLPMEGKSYLKTKWQTLGIPHLVDLINMDAMGNKEKHNRE